MSTISFPESSFPLTSGRKTRGLGATISGAHRCRLRSETGWAEFGYFKMVAPRALVFRPLVKGNEGSGNEIGMATFSYFESSFLTTHASLTKRATRSSFPTAGQRERRRWVRGWYVHFYTPYPKWPAF